MSASGGADARGETGGAGLSWSEALAFGLWFGLLAGLLEVGLRALQRHVFDSRLFLSPDVVWMAPVADVVLYLIAASGVALAGRWIRGARYGTVIRVHVFLLVIGPLLSTPRIHPIASALLAVGAAVQAGRMSRRLAPVIPALVKRTTPVLLLIVLVAAAVVRLGPGLGERRLISALPEADAGSPNVLLIILDTVRADDLSLYGYERATTPDLERLAARGVTFEHALSPSSWTLPAHASMFTGRYPHELSADWERPLDAADLTLAEHLASRGYRTGGFVGNLIYATYETGLQRGFHRYEDYPVSWPMVFNSSWLTRWVVTRTRRLLGREQFLVWKSARDINNSFLDWVDRDRATPFFAFLNYMDAHAPYLPPDSLVGVFGPRRAGRALADLSDRRDWSEEELAAERASYDGAIAYVDQEVGYVLDALEARGLTESTLVVVASDHGEQFGEHGLVDHGNALYRQLLEVPLIVAFPRRVPAGVRVESPVTLTDLPATIVELTLGAASGPSDSGPVLSGPSGVDSRQSRIDPEQSRVFPGQSLADLWEADPASYDSPLLSGVSAGVRMPDWMPIMRGDMASIVHDGFHYILNGDGVEELFAFDDDPAEDRDLAASPEFGSVLSAARARIESLTTRRRAAAGAEGESR